jgi:hypothetical protein
LINTFLYYQDTPVELHAMSDRYRLIFYGETVEGCDTLKIREKLASLLKIDSDETKQLFSGERFVLGENLDLETCRDLQHSFLAIGAFCHIEDPEEVIENDDENLGTETVQVVEQAPSGTTQKKEKHYRKASGALLKKLLRTITTTARLLGTYTANLPVFLSEATESIKSDFEVNGFRLLLKNRYFLSALSAVVIIFSMLVIGLTYERKTMPLTTENFDSIRAHMEFIEKAFTTEELRNMAKNRADFLDYILVHPIEKMGYRFEESITEMASSFLDDKFSGASLKIMKVYLDIAAHEREELLNQGVISEPTKLRLDAVSEKIGE